MKIEIGGRQLGKSLHARLACEAAARAGKITVLVRRDSDDQIVAIPYGRNGRPIVDPEWWLNEDQE